MVSDNFEIVRRRFRILIFLAVIICRRLTDLSRRFLAQFLRIFRYGNIIFPHDRFISTCSAVMIICNAHQFIVRQDPRFIGSLQRIKFSERRTAFTARKPAAPDATIAVSSIPANTLNFFICFSLLRFIFSFVSTEKSDLYLYIQTVCHPLPAHNLPDLLFQLYEYDDHYENEQYNIHCNSRDI